MGQMFMQNLPNQAGNAQAAAAAQEPQGDPIEMLEKLGALLAKGIITQDDFNAKKAELLKRIS